MSAHFRFVVVGAGPCGGRAAAELARLVGPGQVALIGEEAHPPYERPPLSKTFLLAGDEAPPAIMVSAANLEAAGVSLFLGDRALHVAAESRQVLLASGRRVGFGRLLLATGARPRRLSIEGEDLPGVHYLRTHADAAALRAALKAGGRLVVVGGGYIGLEAAASARSLGLQVTVVEAGERLMARTTPAVVAAAVQAMFEARGVTFRLGARPIRIEGERQVSALALSDGQRIPADVVLIGVGAEPNVELARDAGLEVANGIVVDAEGRTSDPEIFAAGDVANRHHPLSGARARLESWEPALDQAAAVAAVMGGAPPRPERAPWVWSDQFDWNIQSLGFPALADCEVVRGDPASGSFLVLQTAAGRLVGAVAVNAGKDMALCRRALAQGHRVDAARARASDTALRDAFSA